MHLITMAHPGEAQGVIEAFNLKRVSQDIFQGEKLILLITGEGPFEAATKSALAMARYNINHVINMGIAGSLSEEYAIGEVLKVRTVYLINDCVPQFKSFPVSSEGVDCLTSFERILDKSKASKLKGMGKLVDREAWGVAMAAKTAGINFECYKVISDFAGSIEACELVKEKAFEFSQIISKQLQEILNRPASKAHELPELQGFHFTFTTGHQFQTLLQKLAIKDEISKALVLEKLNLSDIRSLEISPKEKTRVLLEKMERLIDPIKDQALKTTGELSRIFASHDIKLQFDPLLESPKVKFLFEASNDTELKNKSEVLKNLSISPFQDLMEGRMDVE